jgi:hypothetical protein
VTIEATANGEASGDVAGGVDVAVAGLALWAGAGDRVGIADALGEGEADTAAGVAVDARLEGLGDVTDASPQAATRMAIRNVEARVVTRRC